MWLSALSIISKPFCWDNLAKARDSPILNCWLILGIDGLSLAILWANWSNSCPKELVLTTTFFFPCFFFYQTAVLHERGGMCWRPKTAMAMVRDADSLWDTHGSSDPTVAAATASHSRSPNQAQGQRDDKRGNDPQHLPQPLPWIPKSRQWHV
jgi:hypothetical protein